MSSVARILYPNKLQLIRYLIYVYSLTDGRYHGINCAGGSRVGLDMEGMSVVSRAE